MNSNQKFSSNEGTKIIDSPRAITMTPMKTWAILLFGETLSSGILHLLNSTLLIYNTRKGL
jgi:hypothetical protein